MNEVVPAPLVVAGILNWNGWRDSIACLETVLSSRYERLLVVVLDNGSSDDSIERLRRWSAGLERSHQGTIAAATGEGFVPKRSSPLDLSSGEWLGAGLLLFRSAKNLGFAGGCNTLACIASAYHADYLWLLNNDAAVEATTVRELVCCAQREPAVVGSLVLAADDHSIEFARGRLPHDFFGWTPWRSQPRAETSWASDWVTFASVLVPMHLIGKRLAEHGHFLDDRLFMYVEDVDFCIYARQSGVAVYVSRTGCIRHKRAASSGGKANPRTYYYITRNRVLVARKWFPAPLWAAFIVHYLCTRLLLEAWNVVRGNWQVVRAIAEGIADGMLDRGGRWHRH